MDPDETLKELRELSHAVHETKDYESFIARRIAELFDALDGWIKDGGFLPAEWSKGR